MISSITDQMTSLYVCVDDFLQAHPQHAAWRRSPNAHPVFTDAEVLTVALLQACFQVPTLKQTHRLVQSNYKAAFPHLPSYSQWIARLHALTPLVGQLLQHLLPWQENGYYLLDSKAIPLCQPIRHGRVRLLRDEGAYFGKSSKGWFFGYKLHTLAHQNGAILCAFLAPASEHDRDYATALCECLEQGGVLLADRAYSTKELATQLQEQNTVTLVTPKNCGKEQKPLVCTVRARIETTFSQLWNRFVDRIYSRSFHGLWNTIKLKMLHFNLCKIGVI